MIIFIQFLSTVSLLKGYFQITNFHSIFLLFLYILKFWFYVKNLINLDFYSTQSSYKFTPELFKYCQFQKLSKHHSIEIHSKYR